MYAVETNHWWFAGKRILFKRLLRERLSRGGLRILDVGCGTGAVGVDFSSYGWLCAVDRSIDALAFARSRGLKAVVASEATSLPFADATFDLVIAFDVIEHVANDVGMLLELGRVLRPGGAVAIHVPAWPALWSHHDEILEHKRRYTRKQLRRVLLEAGFRIRHLGWASAAILAPAVAVRASARLRERLRGKPTLAPDGEDHAELYPLSPRLNNVMLSVYKAEALLAGSIGLPFGLSLAAVAER